MSTDWLIQEGDALEQLRLLEAESVQTCVTSPPYWGLRDYGVAGQLGLESTPEEYVSKMVEVFREVRRVLRGDGTAWVNLGDAYAHSGACGGGSPLSNPTDGRTGDQSPRGRKDDRVAQLKTKGTLPPGLKPKDLCGIPWRVAFALQADGWYLRSDIIWHKPNPMPESCTDRPTKAHEYVFLLAKAGRYFYDADAVREPQQSLGERHEGRSGYRAEHPTGKAYGFNARTLHPLGRNRRTVWTIPSQPFSAAHFATFPQALVEPCILAGAPEGGMVLDPFAGSGTVGVVCRKHRRRFVGIELNPEYARMARGRLGSDTSDDTPLFEEVAG